MVNWKTTLVGLGGAVLMVVANWLQTGDLTDCKTLAAALVTAAVGYFAKDAGISGTAK